MQLHRLANHAEQSSRWGSSDRHGLDDQRLSLDGDEQRHVALDYQWRLRQR
jgi:hypothetical protein